MLQSTSLTALSNEIAALAQQASQSTVALHDRGHSFSGFYWRSDVIATAAELVSAKIGREIAVMTPSQDTVAGAVVGIDLSTDIALIRVQATGQPFRRHRRRPRSAQSCLRRLEPATGQSAQSGLWHLPAHGGEACAAAMLGLVSGWTCDCDRTARAVRCWIRRGSSLAWLFMGRAGACC